MTIIKGSTGSKNADADTTKHTVIVEELGDVEIPGTAPLQMIVVDGVRYAHVGEAADGRWTYRKF